MLSKEGRFAKIISFVVKHSSTMDGAETKRTLRDLSWSRTTGRIY